MQAAIRSMTTLNKTAAEISRKYRVHAATDVTGFSFLGHLHEIMGGKLSCIIHANAVPVLPGAEKAADAFLYTAAGQRNRNHTGPFVRFEKVSFAMEEVLFDPQTSGGLLLAFPVFNMERLAGVRSIFSAKSPSEIFRFAIITSKFTIIGIDQFILGLFGFSSTARHQRVWRCVSLLKAYRQKQVHPMLIDILTILLSNDGCNTRK